ncbi:hypothetical protein ES703_124871 [subsurface metagenome]
MLIKKTTPNPIRLNMVPSPQRIMPKAMQIEMLKKFVHDCDVDIDWDHEVDASLSLPENRVELSIIHATCKWFTDEEERKTVKQEALRETVDYIDYLQSITPPEATEEFQEFFDDYLSRYRYALDRKLKISGLKRKIKELEIDLTEAKKRREITPERPPTVRIPSKPRPLTWTSKLERKLRDTFEVTFTRAGLSPRRFIPEYRLELPSIKTLTTQDDMMKAVEALARELVEAEKARKIRPPRVRPPPPVRPPRAPPALPPDEEEEGFIIDTKASPIPEYPEKPFVWGQPRLLTGTEKDDVWRAYAGTLVLAGKDPYRYSEEFEDWLGGFLFKNWDQVQKNYQSLIEVIVEERPLRPPPRALPFETIDRLVQWQVSLKTYPERTPKHETVEEVIDSLDAIGKTGITKTDVIAAIKSGWAENAPNFAIVKKGYLEKLIGEPLE